MTRVERSQPTLDAVWSFDAQDSVRLGKEQRKLRRYRIAFRLGGAYLAGSDIWRSGREIVGPWFAECVLRLRRGTDRLIISPSSNPDYVRRIAGKTVHLTAEQEVYLDFVVSGVTKDHAWITWQVGNSNAGELLVEVDVGDARRLMRKYFDQDGMAAYVLPADTDLTSIAKSVVDHWQAGTPTYWIQALARGGILAEAIDDNCAIRLSSWDVSEEELLGRLDLAGINRMLAEVAV